jgi:hypothetical protein
MTMEMWWLGFYMDRFRLILLALLNVPLLTALSYHAGFEETFSLRDDLIDAFVAYAVGVVAATAVLSLFRYWSSVCRGTKSSARCCCWPSRAASARRSPRISWAAE